MALAIDASTPALASNAVNSNTSVTTASFTPPTGALLLALYEANSSTAGNDVSVSSVTNTGTALTWTRRARKNINTGSTGGAGTDGGAEIWSAVMGTSEAITVTANGPAQGPSSDKLLKIIVLTGADTTALSNVTAASSASGLPSVALAGCLTGSHVFACCSDWLAAGNGTAGTGQTMIDQYNRAGQISAHAWRTTSVLSANGSQTMNMTTPTQQYNLCVIEIRAAGGTDATPTPSTVAAVGAVPAPGKSTGSTVAAVVVAALAAVGAPAVQTGNNATVTPTTVAAVAAVPAPTLHTGSTVASTTVAAVGGVGAMQGATGSTLTPSTAAAVGAVPAPTVSTGSNAAVTATTVAGVAAVPAPTLHTGSTVSPSSVAGIAAVPAPVVSSGSNATVTVVTVAAVSAVAAPTITRGTTAAPSTVAAVAAVPAPTLHTSATVTPASVAAAATVPAPVGIGDISGFGVPVRNPVLHVTSLSSILRLDFVSSALSFTSPASTLELT